MVPCWTIFCASRSAWILCELVGGGCGQRDIRQAASGFLRSFGRTVGVSAEEYAFAGLWKAHHIGRSGVGGEVIAIADWRCEVGMMQRGLSTWRWQARAPSASDRLPVARRIPHHTSTAHSTVRLQPPCREPPKSRWQLRAYQPLALLPLCTSDRSKTKL